MCGSLKPVHSQWWHNSILDVEGHWLSTWGYYSRADPVPCIIKQVMMVSKNQSMHFKFPALDVTRTEWGTCHNVFSKFKESKQKTICSNKFRTHISLLVCTHIQTCMHTNHDLQTEWVLPSWHPSRSPLVTYSVSNCTQVKNGSHAEAQHTLQQPVHRGASSYQEITLF